MALVQRRCASRCCQATGMLANASECHLTLLLLLQVKVETKPWKIEVRGATKQPVQHFNIELPCRRIRWLHGAPLDRHRWLAVCVPRLCTKSATSTG